MTLSNPAAGTIEVLLLFTESRKSDIELTLEEDHRVPDEVYEAEPAALAQAPLHKVHRAGSALLKERVPLPFATMSLYWIHCNRCCQRPRSPEAKFYVTNCGHLFCRACAAAVHKTKKCGACAIPNVGFVQIGPKMSAETKAGFRYTMSNRKYGVWYRKYRRKLCNSFD